MKIKILDNKKIYKQKLFVPVPTTLVCTFIDYILNWLCFPDLPANTPTISKMLEFWKTLIRRIKSLLKNAPYWLVLFPLKLLDGLFSSCLWKKSGTRCFLWLSFFFSIPNITAICKNKILPLFRVWNHIKRTWKS